MGGHSWTINVWFDPAPAYRCRFFPTNSQGWAANHSWSAADSARRWCGCDGYLPDLFKIPESKNRRTTVAAINWPLTIGARRHLPFAAPRVLLKELRNCSRRKSVLKPDPSIVRVLVSQIELLQPLAPPRPQLGHREPSQCERRQDRRDDAGDRAIEPLIRRRAIQQLSNK